MTVISQKYLVRYSVYYRNNPQTLKEWLYFLLKVSLEKIIYYNIKEKLFCMCEVSPDIKMIFYSVKGRNHNLVVPSIIQTVWWFDSYSSKGSLQMEMKSKKEIESHTSTVLCAWTDLSI